MIKTVMQKFALGKKRKTKKRYKNSIRAMVDGDTYVVKKVALKGGK